MLNWLKLLSISELQSLTWGETNALHLRRSAVSKVISALLLKSVSCNHNLLINETSHAKRRYNRACNTQYNCQDSKFALWNSNGFPKLVTFHYLRKLFTAFKHRKQQHTNTGVNRLPSVFINDMPWLSFSHTVKYTEQSNSKERQWNREGRSSND